MGRNKKDDVRSNRIDVRLTDEELKELDYVCRELGLSRSEALRRGIEIQAQTIQYSY